MYMIMTTAMLSFLKVKICGKKPIIACSALKRKL